MLPWKDVKNIFRDLIVVGCLIWTAEYALGYAVVHGIKYAACKWFVTCVA